MANENNAARNNNKGKAIITAYSDSDDSSPIHLKLSFESDDEVQSKVGGSSGQLDSVSDLGKTLPLKRGLSTHYDGKSKSFDNLIDISIESVEELEKEELVLNKKRRLVNANEEYYCKKQPMDHMDMDMDMDMGMDMDMDMDMNDGSSTKEIHCPIDDKEKDNKPKNEVKHGKSKSW